MVGIKGKLDLLKQSSSAVQTSTDIQTIQQNKDELPWKNWTLMNVNSRNNN